MDVLLDDDERVPTGKQLEIAPPGIEELVSILSCRGTQREQRFDGPEQLGIGGAAQLADPRL